MINNDDHSDYNPTQDILYTEDKLTITLPNNNSSLPPITEKNIKYDELYFEIKYEVTEEETGPKTPKGKMQ